MDNGTDTANASSAQPTQTLPELGATLAAAIEVENGLAREWETVPNIAPDHPVNVALEAAVDVCSDLCREIDRQTAVTLSDAQAKALAYRWYAQTVAGDALSSPWETLALQMANWLLSAPSASASPIVEQYAEWKRIAEASIISPAMHYQPALDASKCSTTELRKLSEVLWAVSDHLNATIPGASGEAVHFLDDMQALCGCAAIKIAETVHSATPPADKRERMERDRLIARAQLQSAEGIVRVEGPGVPASLGGRSQ